MAELNRNLKYRNTETYDWEPFRKNLRALMASRGFNGKDCALAVGLAPSTVTRYLTERTPDIVAIWRFADYFKVSIDWLLGRQGSRFEAIPNDVKKLVDGYSVATQADKDVIDLILKKYQQD